MAQGAGQRVGVEVWRVERGGQLGEGASKVGVKVPGVLWEGSAVRTQQTRGLGVASGT